MTTLSTLEFSNSIGQVVAYLSMVRLARRLATLTACLQKEPRQQPAGSGGDPKRYDDLISPSDGLDG